MTKQFMTQAEFENRRRATVAQAKAAQVEEETAKLIAGLLAKIEQLETRIAALEGRDQSAA